MSWVRITPFGGPAKFTADLTAFDLYTRGNMFALGFTGNPFNELLATGKVESVYIYGNIVSVDVARGASADGLGDVVRNMYQYWKPGMEMPTFDAPAEEVAAPAASGDGGDTGGGGDFGGGDFGGGGGDF